MKTENRVGHFKSEYDVQLTFEGDNNVLMQQVVLSFSVFLFIFCVISIFRHMKLYIIGFKQTAESWFLVHKLFDVVSWRKL